MIQKDSPLQISKDELANQSFQQSKINQSNLIHMRWDQDIIQGQCQSFVSLFQKQARQPCIYQKRSQQHPNWQMLACHARNIQYTKQNVRTPKTLQNCLQFICQYYIPYYKEIINNQFQRKRFQLFLYDRVKSIRCQLYVQAVFDPIIFMKLIKFILFLETMIGQPVQLAGLQYFFAPEVKRQLIKDQLKKCYLNQALQLAIFWLKKQKLIYFIENNYDLIFENERLTSLFTKNMKMLNNDYITYLGELIKNENLYIRLILWNKMKKFRQIILARYKKSKMNERAGFLCRVLGYSKMDGWVDISKEGGIAQLQKHKVQHDLQIKLWVPEIKLIEILDQLSNQK